MKRLLVLAIGLGLVLGTVSFAQESTDKKMDKKRRARKEDRRHGSNHHQIVF